MTCMSKEVEGEKSRLAKDLERLEAEPDTNVDTEDKPDTAKEETYWE